MIKLRSLLHVRGLSGHPTMRECLGPSLPANKLHFAGKYFSLVSGFLCFLQSEWKIDPISRNGDNTNLSVSYIITISMGIVNTLTQPCHEKQNWKLTNKIFSQHRPDQLLTWWSDRRLWWGICVRRLRSSQLMLVYPHNSFFQLTHLAKRSFRK